MIDTEDNQKTIKAYERFLGVIKKLREPDGCPWDKVQTPLSMRQDLVEETFEAVDAITQEDDSHAKEELGDVLLNVSMISYMYEQKGAFKMADSINELSDKLIRRHPHVFPQSEGASEVKQKVREPDEVLNQWDRIKQNVEGRKSGVTILDEVPEGFPPMLRAYKMQKKAGKLGFEWKEIEDVLAKVKEELSEVEDAFSELKSFRQTLPEEAKKVPFEKESNEKVNTLQLHVEEEIGDLLFAVVNYARKLGVDPETALNRTNKKFYDRFSYVEKAMKEKGIPQDHEHLKEQENFWIEAKKKGL